MIKLQLIIKDYLWSGEKLKSLFGRKNDGIIAESWGVSVHKDGESILSETNKTFSDYRAEGVANVINAFHPEAILLGGGICAAGDFFLKPLKRKVNKRIYGGTEFAPVEIVVASLGNDAGIYGAAMLAKK